MSSSGYVLDASALLCLLFEEPGAARVADVFHGARISAANYAEVIAKLVERHHPVEEAIADLRQLGLDVVPLDRVQAEAAGGIRAATREAGLSFGDRACLALALTSGRIAVTADRAWWRVDVGVKIEVVR